MARCSPVKIGPAGWATGSGQAALAAPLALAHAYTIDRELRRGGMASVFLAQDEKHESDLDSMRAEPRYLALIKAM